MEKEMNLNTPKPQPAAPKASPKEAPAAKPTRGIDLTSRAWRDMIFTGKNKEFGAYQLRAKSDRRHNFATLYTIIGLVVIALAVWGYSIYNDYKLEQERIAREEAEKMAQAQWEAEQQEEEEIPEEPEQKYEEEIPQVQEEVLESVQQTQIAIMDEVKEENKVQDVEVRKEDDRISGTVTQEGSKNIDDNNIQTAKEPIEQTEKQLTAAPPPVVKEPDPEPKPKVEEKKPEPQQIFKAVEQMPQFPGGQSALMSWLGKNIRYPQTALQNDVQGRVIVEFVVEKDGSVGAAKVVKGVDKDLDREALRVVKAMPHWQPGKNNGQPVRCYYTLPVTFKIQQQ